MSEHVSEKFKEGNKVTVMRGGAVTAVYTITRVLKRYFETQDGSKWDKYGHAYPRAPHAYLGGRACVAVWEPEHSEQFKLAGARRYVEDHIRTGHAVTPELWLKFAEMLRENAENTKKAPEDKNE